MENVKIYVDFREKDSGVPLILLKLGVKVIYQNLTVGDYILPNDYAVERKNVEDFVSSMISGRLFNQAYRLVETYQNPIFLVEGNLQETLETFPKPRSIWGALASLSIRYGVHIFFTANPNQTAELIKILANQAQEIKPIEPVLRERRKIKSLADHQLYVVSSLPGVGLKLADKMLRRFRSVRKIFQASKRELMLIEGLGKSKIEKICELLDSPYKPQPKEGYQKILDET